MVQNRVMAMKRSEGIAERYSRVRNERTSRWIGWGSKDKRETIFYILPPFIQSLG